MSDQRPTLRSITEREWQAQVVQLAQTLGWTVYHTWLSARSTAGFPDLILVCPPRLLFAELKSERGKLKPAQQHWIDLLGLCGVEIHVWRPSDLTAIVELLR